MMIGTSGMSTGAVSGVSGWWRGVKGAFTAPIVGGGAKDGAQAGSVLPGFGQALPEATPWGGR